MQALSLFPLSLSPSLFVSFSPSYSHYSFRVVTRSPKDDAMTAKLLQKLWTIATMCCLNWLVWFGKRKRTICHCMPANSAPFPSELFKVLFCWWQGMEAHIFRMYVLHVYWKLLIQIEPIKIFISSLRVIWSDFSARIQKNSNQPDVS